MTTGLPCIIIIMLSRIGVGYETWELCCRSVYLALKDLEISGTSQSPHHGLSKLLLTVSNPKFTDAPF